MTTDEKRRTRLSLDVSEKVKLRLENLQRLTDAGSHTEVIRRALAFYEIAMEFQAKGGSFLLLANDGTHESFRIL